MRWRWRRRRCVRESHLCDGYGSRGGGYSGGAASNVGGMDIVACCGCFSIIHYTCAKRTSTRSVMRPTHKCLCDAEPRTVQCMRYPLRRTWLWGNCARATLSTPGAYCRSFDKARPAAAVLEQANPMPTPTPMPTPAGKHVVMCKGRCLALSCVALHLGVRTLTLAWFRYLIVWLCALALASVRCVIVWLCTLALASLPYCVAVYPCIGVVASSAPHTHTQAQGSADHLESDLGSGTGKGKKAHRHIGTVCELGLLLGGRLRCNCVYLLMSLSLTYAIMACCEEAGSAQLVICCREKHTYVPVMQCHVPCAMCRPCE